VTLTQSHHRGRGAEADSSALGAYISGWHASWLGERGDARSRSVEGTLVFADVSGFTPLAERLAKQGKVGAEQLTETLNLVFSELLEVAGHFGGDCLKFGGDALLILFSGPHHERRGAAAAHAMQTALKALRRGGSAAGLAKLGISMGVHSGSIQAFLVGTSHRELVLAGPGVDRTLELEGAATRGQILVDDATARALEATDAEVGEAGGRLLVRAPTAAVQELVRPEAGPNAADGIPEVLLAHLDGSRKDGEHRIASVAFVKFGGVDRLLAEGCTETAGAALHDLIRRAQDRCAAHDVTFVATDVDRDGGKLILAAGFPSTSDDDEDRLLLAVQEIVAGTSDQPINARAGVHRGRIFAVDLGGPNRRTFTVMGDTVNLAARVMGRAGWGEVLATDDVVDRCRTDFCFEPLDPFTVKGKAAAIHAQLVGAPRGRRDELEWLDEGSLVGRDAEVAELRATVAAARAGSGRVLELVGEPGIGKSRLVGAMRSVAPDLRVLAFEAGRYSLATPYFALRRGLRAAMGLALDAPAGEVEAVLRRLTRQASPELVPWIPLLAIPLGLELDDTPETRGLDPANRQSTLQHAVVELLRSVLATPTVLTIEDAHWLDAASCDLLRALLHDVGERPWAVMVTRRDQPGGLDLAGLGEVVSRRLQPLDRPALCELAVAASGSTVLPPGMVDDLVDRSGGNPLFLRELVNATVTGSITEVPDTIEAVVGASIDTLAPRDRSLLRHAAVLGGHVPLSVLVAMVDEPTDEVELSLARLAHFLIDAEPGFLRFSHILLRDVAYEGLPYRARRTLHERAGEILEGSNRDPEAMAELLSIHFDRAGRLMESWRYSRVAGERAQRNGAPVEAAAFLERALTAAEGLPEVSVVERAEVAERLGDTFEFCGRYEQSSAAYRRARKLAEGDQPRRVRLCRKLGFVRDHEGRYDTAQRWFRRGLAELEGVEDVAQARALRAELATAVVSSKYRQGRHARALPLIRQAILDAQASGAEAALAHAYFVYDELLIERGSYNEARHSERAAEIYERLGDNRGAAAAHNMRGITAYWLGQWDHAVRCYELAIEADRKAGAMVYNAIYLNNIGEIRSDQGRLVEAEVLLREARDLWSAGGWRAGTGWALSNLGRLASRDGRADEAHDRFHEARGVLADIGAGGMLLETDAREMECFVFEGDHDRALAMADELLTRARRLDLPSVTALVERLQGYASCQAGDPQRALCRVTASLEGSRARGAQYEVALSAEALARIEVVLGMDEHATRRAVEADECFERLGVVATPSVPL
jgi:class 3 adenylate cyclase/tetratricopeptide (TPR) repeat protein